MDTAGEKMPACGEERAAVRWNSLGEIVRWEGIKCDGYH